MLIERINNDDEQCATRQQFSRDNHCVSERDSATCESERDKLETKREDIKLLT